TEEDKAGSQPTAIVNETFVRKLFPDVSTTAAVVGRRISFGSNTGPFIQVVGVARDGKYFNIAEEPGMFVWTPLAQKYSAGQVLVVRTTGDPQALLGPVRNQINSLDANLPVFDVKTMNEHMRFSLFPARVAATVLSTFGLVALVLAVIGIYGVTS